MFRKLFRNKSSRFEKQEYYEDGIYYVYDGLATKLEGHIEEERFEPWYLFCIAVIYDENNEEHWVQRTARWVETYGNPRMKLSFEIPNSFVLTFDPPCRIVYKEASATLEIIEIKR